MKVFVRALILGFTLTLPGLAADAALASAPESLKRVLDLTEAQFLSAAKAMPEKLFSFSPTGPGFAGVRTFAEQLKHVACGNFAFFNEIEHKTPPEHCEKGGPAKAAKKSELIQYLREAFDYGNKVLAALRRYPG